MAHKHVIISGLNSLRIGTSWRLLQPVIVVFSVLLVNPGLATGSS